MKARKTNDESEKETPNQMDKQMHKCMCSQENVKRNYAQYTFMLKVFRAIVPIARGPVMHHMEALIASQCCSTRAQISVGREPFGKPCHENALSLRTPSGFTRQARLLRST